MAWQRLIIDRLQLDSLEKAIVFDETGILLSPEFTNYLKEDGYNFTAVINQQDWFSGDADKMLFITGQKNVPSFLKNDFQLLAFRYDNLPFIVEKKLRNAIQVRDLILFLECLDVCGSPLEVREKDFNEIKKQALDEMKLFQLDQSHKRINQLISLEPAIDNLLNLGREWGEYLFLKYQLNLEVDPMLTGEVDGYTQRYVEQAINEIVYSSTNKLYSVHNVLPYLAGLKHEKIAMVCFDGMGWAEWRVIREYLDGHGLRLVDQPQLALIPSITSISRAALFSGQYYAGFKPKKIPDDKAFTDFWRERGFSSAFFRSGQFSFKEKLTGYNRIALLFNFVDEISHGMLVSEISSSKNRFFQSLHSYCQSEEIYRQFNLLKEEGFKIFICSDHGSVVARGNDRKIDKFLIDSGSKRGTIVQNTILSDTLLGGEIMYSIPGVRDVSVVMAGQRTMYGSSTKSEITHGGATLEELVVPFAEVLK